MIDIMKLEMIMVVVMMIMAVDNHHDYDLDDNDYYDDNLENYFHLVCLSA